MHTIDEPASPATSRSALWALGFRPFYLLASGYAALSVPLWALQFSGWLPQVHPVGPTGHAHEMLFGFVLAVIVGFLLTAGRTWSGQPTPSGRWPAALAGLWVVARVLAFTPFGWAAAMANMAFPLAAAAVLAVPFHRARNRRNYFFVGLLVLMALASGAVHLSRLGAVPLPAWPGLQVGLDVVLFIVVVMAGRVVPMFTNNGVPGAGASRRPAIENAALGLVLLLAVSDAAGVKGWPLSTLTAIACVVHAARWALWRPWKTAKAPLVRVLHVAYAWVPVHLALRSLAALVRVAVPLAAPALTLSSIQASAALWSCGFGPYAVRYWPVLTRQRLDGKPGSSVHARLVSVRSASARCGLERIEELQAGEILLVGGGDHALIRRGRGCDDHVEGTAGLA